MRAPPQNAAANCILSPDCEGGAFLLRSDPMPRVLYLFAVCNLVMGSGAFVISGILVPISTSLGVSVPAAGQAMTAYALATAVLAPLGLMLTGGWPRKRALVFGLAVFAAGNLLCALATSLAMLLTGRVLMGLGALVWYNQRIGDSPIVPYLWSLLTHFALTPASLSRSCT